MATSAFARDAVTMLLAPGQVEHRRSLARGVFQPLVRSLREDLDPLITHVITHGEPWIPPDKARLTRMGGRCPADGTLLDFDPWQPHRHCCPACGAVHGEAEHYRWWIMNYQLWLAERAVHAATLHVLTDDADCGTLAERILRGFAERYASYPNRDNVLGPTRPFFSTYLESIWLLQLTLALDLLEGRTGQQSLGAEVRERLVRPSAALIASYDEGLSNRQVYHNAALAAAGVSLGDDTLVAAALTGPSGVATHFARALLADGTWYEGENYHLFAHRGLWYGVTIAEAVGIVLPPEGVRRFREAFATPFATALPDFTFPSRRDSQYRVSLRQWRMAESCELGLARGDDPRLEVALAELYRREVGEGGTGRDRSTAEAERNVGPVRLSRASLGWKSLLFARDGPPAPGGQRPASVHLTGQGLAVLRRDAGRTYVALDYGESGGGHGHPDRLNLWLVSGEARILEDVGTGSYVSPTLHWYRSTLAHNAPMADGRSQWRAAGEFLAYDERGEAGLVAARAHIAPGVEVERRVVVMDRYLVDEVRWRAERVVTFDLPFHVDAELVDGGRWRPEVLAGGRGLEDGFDFVSAAEQLPGAPTLGFIARVGGIDVRAWVDCDMPHEWWRCAAPGPPGEGYRRFLLVRSRERAGCIRSLWSWEGVVTSATFERSRCVVRRGASDRDEHTVVAGGWEVASVRAGRPSTIVLATGTSARPVAAAAEADSEWAAEPAAEPANHAGNDTGNGPPARAGAGLHGASGSSAEVVLRVVPSIPPRIGGLAGHGGAEGAEGADGVARFVLGREHYRRSEASWEEAGAPAARVAVAATPDDLVLEVAVVDPSPLFAAAGAENALDNEHPDTNSDGVQLYVGLPHGSGRYYAWILVPEGGRERDDTVHPVRVTARVSFGPPLPIVASACLTPDGWALRIVLPRRALAPDGRGDFTLDLIVNEISAGRERRRGQLVLSGGRGEWIYLRGDRQDSARALPFRLSDD